MPNPTAQNQFSYPPQSPLPTLLGQSASKQKINKMFVWMFLGMVCTLFLFFTPLPYYVTQEVDCKMGGEKCPYPGWNWGDPLWRHMLLVFTHRSVIDGNYYLINFPSPSNTFHMFPSPSTQISDTNFENRKLYKNEKYGYTVEYPPEVEPTELVGNKPYFIHKTVFTSNSAHDYSKDFFVSVNNTRLAEQIDSVIGNEAATLLTKSQITVDGYSGFKLVFGIDRSENEKGVPYSEIVVVHNGIYSYVLHGNVQALDVILSTFRFLNPSSSPPPLIRYCHIADLEVEPGFWNGATGSLFGYLGITNQSLTPCQLFGYPDTVLRNSRGENVSFSLNHFSPYSEPAMQIVLSPGDKAQVTMLENNYCFTDKNIYTFYFYLPTDTARPMHTEPASSGARCDLPDGSVRLSIGPFTYAEK